MKKTFLVIGLAAIGVLGAVFWPRVATTQDQILGGDDHVILVKRKRHIVPREFHSTGGMNPINIWSYLPDPTFESNTINSDSFENTHGAIGHLAIQGFNINRAFDSKDIKEDLIAIRFDGTVYEYTTPGFLFFLYSRSRIHLLQQKGSTLTFFFGATGTENNVQPALIQVVLPFGSMPAELILESDQPRWSQEISELAAEKLDPAKFIGICEDGTTMSFVFAKLLFGKSC